MIRLLACLVAICAPLPALALSCAEPSVARGFHAASAAPETYVVVHGRLSFDEGALPKGMTDPAPPKQTKLPARITGTSLSMAGFIHHFDREITLEVLCFGPWCGGAVDGMGVLAFVEKADGRYTMTIDPCGGFVYPNPSEDQINTIQQCFRGESCLLD